MMTFLANDFNFSSFWIEKLGRFGGENLWFERASSLVKIWFFEIFEIFSFHPFLG